MPRLKELTPVEAYENLERRAALLSKLRWPFRIALAFSVVGMIVSFFTGQHTTAVGLSVVVVVMMMALGQQEEYELLLKLLPKPGETTVASGK